MNIVVSDPKTGKAFSKKTEEAVFVGKKVGEEVSLDAIGLNGFKGRITGGSDSDGFPMKPSLEGTGRKKILIGKGTGSRNKKKGERKRKTVRGNTVSNEIAQLNIAITNYGSQKIEELLGKTKTEKTTESTEAKEGAEKSNEGRKTKETETKKSAKKTEAKTEQSKEKLEEKKEKGKEEKGEAGKKGEK